MQAQVFSFLKSGKRFIILEFGDGEQYLYNDEKPGKIHVDRMIALACKRNELNTYINKYVRDNYSQKLK